MPLTAEALPDTGASWSARALCAETDPDLFWPASTNGTSSRQAIWLCRRCPVQPQCLEDVLGSFGLEQPGGIWGGYGRNQRRIMIRARERLKQASLPSGRVLQSGDE